jgi:hypothetical protein
MHRKVQVVPQRKRRGKNKFKQDPRESDLEWAEHTLGNAGSQDVSGGLKLKGRKAGGSHHSNQAWDYGFFASCPLLDVFQAHTAILRSVSISLSHAIIWFQLGMLWDAK